jgi:3-phosphoshikimate 1-carboxyvinyltransferase
VRGQDLPDYFEALFAVAAAAPVPVICIDGPTASGKGTLAAAWPQRLGYHCWTRRAVPHHGLAARGRPGARADDEAPWPSWPAPCPCALTASAWLGDEDVSDAIRTERPA